MTTTSKKITNLVNLVRENYYYNFEQKKKAIRLLRGVLKNVGGKIDNKIYGTCMVSLCSDTYLPYAVYMDEKGKVFVSLQSTANNDIKLEKIKITSLDYVENIMVICTSCINAI